jgi:DNA-binding NarL/FixJ family response regulator
MRVVLVGRPRDRERLRQALADSSLDIVGEAATLAAGRTVTADVEALVVSAGPSPADDNAPEHVESLTPRETEVLELVAEGLPNRTIAVRLAISDQTVKFHIASIAGKLGARNRTDAVRIAIQRGLVGI